MDRVVELRRGDVVEVVTRKGTMRYRVDLHRELTRTQVAEKAQALFGQDRGAGTLVLITCTDWNGSYYEKNVVITGTPLGQPRALAERAQRAPHPRAADPPPRGEPLRSGAGQTNLYYLGRYWSDGMSVWHGLQVPDSARVDDTRRPISTMTSSRCSPCSRSWRSRAGVPAELSQSVDGNPCWRHQTTAWLRLVTPIRRYAVRM